MGPRNAYKDMLDNVVNLITCVSMNHQNQLEQMENGAMFATTCCCTLSSSLSTAWSSSSSASSSANGSRVCAIFQLFPSKEPQVLPSVLDMWSMNVLQ
jgi:hypothetical protein